MRSLLGLMLACTAVLTAEGTAAKPQLQEIHTVYLLSMGNSLDQFLANRLTAAGIFQVVTDPQKADAIFSDKIGLGLEQKLDELYPPPVPKKVEDDKDKDKDPYGKPAQRFGSFSRGRGTVFLVDRKTRNVVWSIYWPIKSGAADDTNKRAGDIVKKLHKDLGGK